MSAVPSAQIAAAMRLLADALEQTDGVTARVVDAAPIDAAASWRERLWTAHTETRLGVVEAAEAWGRPKSWIYRHTGVRCAVGERRPCRRLDGELVFVVGELRAWLAAHEEIVTPGRADARL